MRARRDGKPHQGMPARSLCRPDLDGKSERQSAEVVVRITCLRAHDRLAAHGFAGNGTCKSHSRNHPPQTPEAWRASDGQRPARKDRYRVRQPHEGRVRVCSPATMFRRLKRLVSTCQKYIAEGANTPALEDPAHKPRLLKRPENSQGSPYATPFTDRGAGEICGIGKFIRFVSVALERRI